MKPQAFSYSTILLGLSLAGPLFADNDRSAQYSPYAGRDYPDKVLFGDTHHHTANSGDAFFNGDRLGPADAYRFARGEEQ